MDLTKLGRRLQYERRRLRLTQEELASEVGMTKAVLGSVERGERSLSLERLMLLANRFGVTPDYLLQDYLETDGEIMYQYNTILRNQPVERREMALNVLRAIFSYFKKD